MTRSPSRKIYLLVFVFLVCVFSPRFLGQHTVQKPTDVEMRVQTADGRTEFRVGEIIPLKLLFSSSAPGKYQIIYPTNRNGRPDCEAFQIEPRDGWSDPLKLYYSGDRLMFGGIPGFAPLSDVPTVLPLDLNEWVRFDKPGEYTLRVVSSRVADLSNEKEGFPAHPELPSNELRITITAPEKSWQDETLKSALAILDKPNQTKNRPTTSESDGEDEKAAKILRYLGTEDAMKEMAKRLTDENTRYGSDCFWGLVGSPQPEVAITELERWITDPDYTITHSFISALNSLMRSREHSAEAIRDEDASTTKIIANEGFTDADPANRKVIMGKVRPAVSFKRGKALALTLMTVLETPDFGLNKDDHDAMIEQLVSLFDLLSVNQQEAILGWNWDTYKGPAFLPVLRKYAQASEDLDRFHAYMALEVSGSALRRWHELEPAEARPVIIKEILRPELRYSLDTLGILSDQTLPEVEQSLARRFSAKHPEIETIASLINRYATESIKPQVLSVADKHIRKWDCATQGRVLAYLLRVDPETARPRLEAAIAAREDYCYQQLFEHVGALRQDPLLEELAIRALGDDDPELAGDAAVYLGRNGSAAAEQKLWDRLTQWNEKWKDRVEEFRSVRGVDNANENELSLDHRLVYAIKDAKSWTLDENKLRRLRQLALEPYVQKEVDDAISEWAKKPWPIIFIVSYGKQSFHVFRYEAGSIEAVKEKLVQLPPGSTFEWDGPFVPDEDSKKVATELSEFLASHGMKLTISSN